MSGQGNLAPWTKKETGTLFFPQNVRYDVLCGQYSINHILQEEKCVWQPGQPRLIGAAGAAVDPMDPRVKINLWALCQEYERIVRSEALEKHVEGEYTQIQNWLQGRVSRITNAEVSARTPIAEIRRLQAKYNSNLSNYRKTFEGKSESEAKAIIRASATPQNTFVEPESLCKMDDALPGMLPIQMFDLLLPMLNFAYESIYRVEDFGAAGGETVHDRVIKKFREECERRDLLGVVLLGHGHYVAVVKYSGNCKYTLIDSLFCKQTHAPVSCLSLEEILPKITARLTHGSEDVEGGAVFIYARPDSYRAVAVQRMRHQSLVRNAGQRLLNEGRSANEVRTIVGRSKLGNNVPAIMARAANVNREKAERAANRFAFMTMAELLGITIEEVAAFSEEDFVKYNDAFDAAVAEDSKSKLVRLTSTAAAEAKASTKVANPVNGKPMPSFGSTNQWTCPICTVDNPISNKVCEVCGQPKPASGGKRKTRRARKQKRKSTLRR